MICALLVFQTPDLPAPLGDLSPWVDRLTAPQDELFADSRRSDTAGSSRPTRRSTASRSSRTSPTSSSPATRSTRRSRSYHQGANIDRAVLRRLVGLPEPTAAPAPRPELHDWLVDWIEDDPAPGRAFDSLPGVLWHLTGAWARRSEPNVLLVHYDDLERDLDGAMRGLAARLGSRSTRAPGRSSSGRRPSPRCAPVQSRSCPIATGSWRNWPRLPPRNLGRRRRGADGELARYDGARPPARARPTAWVASPIVSSVWGGGYHGARAGEPWGVRGNRMWACDSGTARRGGGTDMR